MRYRLCFLCLCASFAAFCASIADVRAADADPRLVLGKWTPPKMDAVIDVHYCGERLCAELVDHDYENLATTDVLNPDPGLRNRPLLGVHILDGLVMASSDKWKDGELYDPRTGKTYLSKIKLLDKDRVKIIGCVGPGLCKGYVWTRVKS
ncbi:MAG: DUF2147 domain-containing protein [Pseudomonadota bacterium]